MSRINRKLINTSKNKTSYNLFGMDNNFKLNEGIYSPHKFQIHDNNIEQYGGANGGISVVPFTNSHRIYIIANGTDANLRASYFARLDKLKISKYEQSKLKPHITMMEIDINMSNPDHRVIIDSYKNIHPSLRNLLNMYYNQLSPQMYLTSGKGNYEIMGDYLAKVYQCTNSQYVTYFRMAFYKYIEKFLGKGTRSSTVINGKKYYIYNYKGKDLMAIPDYYHGKGVWVPHLSLIKLSKIKQYNPLLYSNYKTFGISALINALSGVMGSLHQLNMSYHFNTLLFSIT